MAQSHFPVPWARSAILHRVELCASNWIPRWPKEHRSIVVLSLWPARRSCYSSIPKHQRRFHVKTFVNIPPDTIFSYAPCLKHRIYIPYCAPFSQVIFVTKLLLNIFVIYWYLYLYSHVFKSIYILNTCFNESIYIICIPFDLIHYLTTIIPNYVCTIYKYI